MIYNLFLSGGKVFVDNSFINNLKSLYEVHRISDFENLQKIMLFTWQERLMI